jgi:SAM-dependent methyltransferase
MPIEVIDFKGETYPAFQASGNAARFVMPFAKEVCVGEGYDIGCAKEEWKFPNAQGIDLVFDDEWNAYNLPNKQVDFIFSSHCLEHLDSWVEALEYWTTKLKSGGVLFLYLPHRTQKYWLPWNNRKHKHILREKEIINLLLDLGYKYVIPGHRDLNCSFTIMAEKG